MRGTTIKMASTSRKRKLKDGCAREHEECGPNPSVSYSDSIMGTDVKAGTEDYDPNLEFDSCGPRDNRQAASEQPQPLLVTNMTVCDSTDYKTLPSQKRQRDRRQSHDGGCLNTENAPVFVSKHRRKYSAPTDIVRPASPAGQSKFCIHKKLILRKPASPVVQSGAVEQEDDQGVPASQDVILQDMMHCRTKRNQGQNGFQSDSENNKVSMPSSSNIADSHRQEIHRGDKTPGQQEDFDSNLDKDECGDSDEELPDVLGSSQGTKTTIQKKDLIWVKYRKFPHWPAIVRHTYYKKRRLTKVAFSFIGELYDGDRTRAMRMSYRPNYIVPFTGKDHQLFKQTGKESAFSEYFEAAVDKTEEYIMKRALDPSLDALEFFKSDIHCNDPATWEDGDFISETSSEKTEGSVKLSDTEEVEEDAETSGTEDVKDILTSNEGAELPEELKQIQEKRISRNKKLLECMTSEGLQNHLCAVKNGQTHSMFHQQFLEDEKRASLNCIFGPIVEDDQQDDVMKILSEIFKKVYGPDQLLENRNYVLSVWVPEAVLYSIMRVQKIGKERAMKVLMSGPHLTVAENQQRHYEIISSGTELTQQEVQNAEKKYKKMLKKLKKSQLKF